MVKKISCKKVFGQKKFGRNNFWVNKIFVKQSFCKKNFGLEKFLVKKFLVNVQVKKVFGSKKILGQKQLGQISRKHLRRKIFCPKKIRVGLTQRGRMLDPPLPENSRVKIVLGCCQFCQVRSHTKFQTTRTFISSRSRVPGGGWVGGVNSNNRVKPIL